MTSAEYYRKNPKARAYKARMDKIINSRPEQIKKRVEANRKRSEAKKNGKNVNGKDYDHAVNAFVATSVNRGRNGEGGRKKKY